MLQEADLVDRIANVQTQLLGLVGVISVQARYEETIMRLKTQSDFYPENQEWLRQGCGEEGWAVANMDISWQVKGLGPESLWTQPAQDPEDIWLDTPQTPRGVEGSEE